MEEQHIRGQGRIQQAVVEITRSLHTNLYLGGGDVLKHKQQGHFKRATRSSRVTSGGSCKKGRVSTSRTEFATITARSARAIKQQVERGQGATRSKGHKQQDTVTIRGLIPQ